MMKKSIIITGLMLGFIAATYVVNASESYENKGSKGSKGSEYMGYSKSSKGMKYTVSPANDPLYKAECASCHFAYQPGLLPSKSWKKMMQAKELENHFGTDASLEEEDRVALAKYLEKNASDKVKSRLGQKIARSIPKNSTLLAISKTKYFQHEHDEIPKRLIEQKEVKSIANCIACHTTADKGFYGERDIKIPNYGRWDD